MTLFLTYLNEPATAPHKVNNEVYESNCKDSSRCTDGPPQCQLSEKKTGGNRTDAPLSLLPDAFHMTEREREGKRDGTIGRERAAQPMKCSRELIQLSPLNEFNQACMRKRRMERREKSKEADKVSTAYRLLLLLLF